ncbi:MAG TPA: glycosyltransferase family 9 protein [Fimbriimonas sp.]|nr:glycosyltransferase family 9 protein [Fimbriimonas sp.]
MKVLIVRFSAIGDCVMAGVAVNDVVRTVPGAEVHWVVADGCHEVVSVEKSVLPRKAWKAKGEFRTLFEQFRWHCALRRFGFDIGFDLQGHSKTAWCLRLSGAKRRIGLRATDAMAAKLNPQTKLVRPPDSHEIDWYRFAFIQEFGSQPVTEDFLLGARSERQSGLVTINVGAGHRLKTIPGATLRDVGAALAREGKQVVYIGGPRDTIDAPNGTTSRVGQTSLLETLELVRSSSVHVCGDTGTGHIAAVTDTPLVSVWGNMPLSQFRPYTDRAIVLNRNGDPTQVDASEILEAVRCVS